MHVTVRVFYGYIYCICVLTQHTEYTACFAKKCRKNVCLLIVGSCLTVELKCFVGIQQMMTVQDVAADHHAGPTLKQPADYSCN